MTGETNEKDNGIFYGFLIGLVFTQGAWAKGAKQIKYSLFYFFAG